MGLFLNIGISLLKIGTHVNRVSIRSAMLWLHVIVMIHRTLYGHCKFIIVINGLIKLIKCISISISWVFIEIIGTVSMITTIPHTVIHLITHVGSTITTIYHLTHIWSNRLSGRLHNTLQWRLHNTLQWRLHKTLQWSLRSGCPEHELGELSFQVTILYD